MPKVQVLRCGKRTPKENSGCVGFLMPSQENDSLKSLKGGFKKMLLYIRNPSNQRSKKKTKKTKKEKQNKGDRERERGGGGGGGGAGRQTDRQKRNDRLVLIPGGSEENSISLISPWREDSK